MTFVQMAERTMPGEGLPSLEKCLLGKGTWSPTQSASWGQGAVGWVCQPPGLVSSPQGHRPPMGRCRASRPFWGEAPHPQRSLAAQRCGEARSKGHCPDSYAMSCVLTTPRPLYRQLFGG